MLCLLEVCFVEKPLKKVKNETNGELLSLKDK